MIKRSLVFFSILVTVAMAVGAEESSTSTVRIMTYNIRNNNAGDGINAWPNRKEYVAEMARDKYKADLLGVQEALIDQVHDMEQRLPQYKRVGVARDDGWEKGEHMAIFFLKDRFDLLQTNTFWLSETPEIPGVRSWDSNCNRVVTWAKLKDKQSGREFYYFNTHFDHISQKARLESAKLVWTRIQSIAGNLPVVLSGDFNIYESNEAYAILTGKEPAGDSRSDLQDARYISKSGHKGPTASTVNNDWTEMARPESKIDYIFVRNGFTVLSHQIAEDKYNDRFPSDHLPVVAELEFPSR